MRAIGIKTLKNKLSEYVRLASTGETVLISDRDQVVAELGPPEPGRARRVGDALLADAVRCGLVTPAILPPGPPPETMPVAPVTELMEELETDRGER